TAPAPLGYQARFTHDADGNLLRVERDNVGADGAAHPTLPVLRTEFEYDATGDLVLRREAIGAGREAVTLYDYDGNRNLAGITLPEGDRIELEHDAENRATAVTRAANVPADRSRSRREYDADGNPVKRWIEGGFRDYEMVYDDCGNLISIKRWSGMSTFYIGFGVDQEGLVNSIGTGSFCVGGDARVRRFDLKWDERRRMVEIVQQGTLDGLHLLHEYDPADNRTRTTDSNGVVDDAEYNRANEVIDAGRARGTKDANTFTYLRDKNGNAAKQTVTLETGGAVGGGGEARTFVTERSFDALDRPEEIRRDPEGKNETTRVRYDSRGNPGEVVDARGRVHLSFFDGLGLPTEVVEDATGKNVRIGR
ncbi:MAG: hypothetical protein AAB249_05745, partial [Acidobacteriota bacterium]